MDKIKKNIINLGIQRGKLKSLFPSSTVTISKNVLTWKHNLQPSPLSEKYKIKLIYRLGKSPNVYVLSPVLRKRKKEDDFNHLYSEDKQWLCLYYKRAREWDTSMLLADILVPWISEWLLHYEIWSVTGKWNGGGIQHDMDIN
ncbi:hypothetical protein [Marinifilum caeruleilacunae]|uniref:Type II CBASS E2 protein domain-containing protein n=1 Tax=Marinifilum caeruleilacunae TaxID=2499076 RepID=A0ABX1WS36_9BACT|nr:hypothetical protein [Marinifilum caeruleilacunae]NOU58886.1 hypothetical protein [Marinifilum caeruleilacunae]